MGARREARECFKRTWVHQRCDFEFDTESCRGAAEEKGERLPENLTHTKPEVCLSVRGLREPVSGVRFLNDTGVGNTVV